MKYKEWLNEWITYYVKPTTKERTCRKYGKQVENHIALELGEYEIGTFAFEGTNISTVVVPESVTEIGSGAFLGCPLTEITIPFVGYSATTNSSSMGTYNANNHSYLNYLFGGTEYNSTNYVPSQLKTVIVTGTATTISPYAFYNCANLNFITIDHEIASIGQQAFKGCASLKAITLNSSVPTLGNDALMDTPDDMILRVSDENKADYQVKWNMDESRICGQNKSYVLFESRGGSAVDALFVNNGDTIIEPIVPRRSNYIFLGWYSDIKLQNKFDFSMPIDRDITLYAKWQYQSIELDTEVTIDMNNYAGETYYFTFTPETSGYFTIRSI